jgi:cytochrome c biogenesis protein CcmG/thiol:disulfide interchange protein DsbE
MGYRKWGLVGWRRLAIVVLTVTAVALLAGCSSATASELAAEKFTRLEDFPEGFGRGFPEAQPPAGAALGKPIQIGDIPPDFAIVLEDGRHTSLRALYGQPVVINFWATWCGPCRREMPELMRAADEDPDLVMLAVNVQEPVSTVEPFAAEFRMNSPIPLDPQGLLQDVYGVRGLPTTFFVAKDGRVAAIYPGALTSEALAERLAVIR